MVIECCNAAVRPKKKTGRPRIIRTPDELEALIDAYFHKVEMQGCAPTITGMALALGLSGRKVLNDYARSETFGYAVKRAKLRIESYYEDCLTTMKDPTGAIFALKNFGWRNNPKQCNG